MQKSRTLIVTALAALALCASAFAAPTASESAGHPAHMQVSADQHDVAPAAAAATSMKVVQAAKDVSPISLHVADTGSGAASAYQAWAKRQTVAAIHPGIDERELHPMAGKGKGGGKKPPKRIDLARFHQLQLLPFTRST